MSRYSDLLLQVVYHAQIASEAAAFSFNDVAAAIADPTARARLHEDTQRDLHARSAADAGWTKLWRLLSAPHASDTRAADPDPAARLFG